MTNDARLTAIDWQGLRSRREQLSRCLQPGVDVVVSPFDERQAGMAADVIRRLAEAATVEHPEARGRCFTSVHPRAAGLCLWVSEPWEVNVSALADALTETGVTAQIGPPSADFDIDALRGLGTTPTLFTAFSIDPSAAAGPKNPRGLPEARWGVPEAITSSVASDAVDFVFPKNVTSQADPGHSALCEDLLQVAVDAECGAALLGDALERLPSVQRLFLRSSTVDPRRAKTTADAAVRGAYFTNLGQATWSSYDPSSLDTRLDRLVGLATRYAARLDYAAIRPAYPLFCGEGMFVQDYWSLPRFRDSWSDRVPDASPIQVLTDAHLEKAHDLSRWVVRPLTEGRSLVSSTDLAAWFAVPPNTPVVAHWSSAGLLHAAREDFGAMILTRDGR